MLKLFNTLTRKKEVFKSLKDKEVGLYTCGPTVYDYDHIGHAWNYFNADILRRVLEFNSYKVNHVMNITDVGHLTSDADEGEDKLEKGAKREGKSPWEIAEFYTKIYLENRRKINLLEPNIICKATDHIPEMVGLNKKLEAKGSAYEAPDGLYFDLSKFPKYGQLSGNTLEKLKAGTRVEVNPNKKNPYDFALWLKAVGKHKAHSMIWDSPWGKGFPGWHIECSAMSMKYLGEHFDLHTGGEDNIFPHHECEIAQSEAATGKKFVNFWLHTRFLTVEGTKMSKSLNNFFRIQDLEEKGFNPLSLRYLFLTAHYRTKLNFTWQSLEAAENGLKKLYGITAELQNGEPRLPAGAEAQRPEKAEDYRTNFLEFINDDLDLPKALALVWKMLDDGKLSDRQKYVLLLDFDKVFGLGLDKIKRPKIPKDVVVLVRQREKYREQKNWQKADEIRQKIEKLGYQIEDIPDAPKIKILG